MSRRNIPTITAEKLRESGFTVMDAPKKMRTALREMPVGMVYAFQGVVHTSLLSVISMVQQDPIEPKKFKEIGCDPVNRIYFIQRIS